MTLSLRFLGSGDAFGSGGRLPTCMLLTDGADAALIDCGPAALVAMRRDGIDPGTVGVVLLSHLHGDHFAGVPFLVLDGQFSRRTRPLIVAGPPGTRARIEATMELLFPGSTGVARRFATEWIELSPGVATPVGPARVTGHPVEHASGATPFALRVEWAGRTVTYSGDTEWTDGLVDAARDADLFVCEAYTFDTPRRYHLDYRTLAANRARLSCRRLVLTHMGPEMLARRAEADAECAEDGFVIVVD